MTPFRGELPTRVFTKPFELNRSQGIDRNRAALPRARELLRESGWMVRDDALTNNAGERFSLSFVIRSVDERRIITHSSISCRPWDSTPAFGW